MVMSWGGWLIYLKPISQLRFEHAFLLPDPPDCSLLVVGWYFAGLVILALIDYLARLAPL